MPTAPLGVCRGAAVLAVGVADLLDVTALPTAVASRNFVEPSFSVAFDALLFFCGYPPLADSAVPEAGVAAGVCLGHPLFGSE